MRVAFALLLLIASASADEIVLTPTISRNLLPGISGFLTSGDATFAGDTGYCSPGEACTGAQGGTYSTTIDATNEMSIAEINAGFDLTYGVSVLSHESNASLPTCDQTGGDCQDNFNLTLTLQDGTAVVEKYEHEFVLDYAGLREYQFEQTVVSNSWVELSMLLELYGQDAGYPTGLYGPQFTDPWLTTGYDAISFVQSQIVDVIQDDMNDALDFIDEITETEVVIIQEETFVVDAEEIFSNPVLSEIIGTGNTVTVTLSDAGSGDIIDSFEIDVQSEAVTDLAGVDDFSTDTDFSSFETVDDFAPPEPMGFEEQQPEMSFAEALDEMPEMESFAAELDSAEIEMTEPDISEPAAEPASEPAAEDQPEPASVASTAVKKTEPSRKVSAKAKAKAKKRRIVKKISTRVMATLSQNYEAAMQGAALSVMRMSAPTYKSTELNDLEDWYIPVEFDGGTNYDHPSAMWIAAQAGQDMNDLVKMQWRK